MKKMKEKVDKEIIKTANNIIKCTTLHRAVSTELPDCPIGPGPRPKAPGNSLPRPKRSQSIPRPLRPPHPTVPPPAPPTFPTEEEGYYAQVEESGDQYSEEGDYIAMGPPLEVSGSESRAGPEDETLGGGRNRQWRPQDPKGNKLKLLPRETTTPKMEIKSPPARRKSLL